MTLHGPNNRYVNDEQILQAIASMWTRIGVQTQVAASPMADFSSRVSIRRKEFSAWLLGWGAQTGEVSSPLRALTACENADKGFGTNNGMSYCNQKADALLEQGLAEVDDAKRLKLFQDAVRLVIKDGAFMPIHQQVTTWAARKGIDYVPRTDERTYAHNFKPTDLSGRARGVPGRRFDALIRRARCWRSSSAASCRASSCCWRCR